LFRHIRHDLRSGRGTAREQHGLRQSGIDVLTRSGDLMVMVILGGMGSLFGPVLGAIAYLVLEEFLSQVTEYWALIMGPLLLLVVLFGRVGVLGGCALAEPLLRVENLVRWFDGIVATDNVSLNVARGELHAIIGPNGAGKTTLISQLTGQLLPDSGAIYLAGKDITRVPAWRRSALGLARSFQITSLLSDFTALDNVALAAQAHDGHSFHFWGNARKVTHLRKAAQSALDRVGLGHRGDVVVSQLSHGEQRELELAVALATRPQLLLLDEPMAGLGVKESARMVKLLQELRREVSIVLVEHDMSAVFALADRITVLVYGRIIASGQPSEIRQNEEVKRAYLGEQNAVTRHGVGGFDGSFASK
jgi:branched-chain amino acid transport system ATP-binding protein